MRRIPVRTCVSCRTPADKASLIRVVRPAGGGVVIDPSGKLPGRGAYLCRAKECLAQAVKKNKLGRALRCDIPDGLIRELENLVVKDDDPTEN